MCAAVPGNDSVLPLREGGRRLPTRWLTASIDRAMTKTPIRLEINGAIHEVAVRPYDVLLDVIRESLNLTGTKRGCDMGTCGCCTVLIDGRARLSCLTLALDAAGAKITTVEGLKAARPASPPEGVGRRRAAASAGSARRASS